MFVERRRPKRGWSSLGEAVGPEPADDGGSTETCPAADLRVGEPLFPECGYVVVFRQAPFSIRCLRPLRPSWRGTPIASALGDRSAPP